MLTQWSTTNYSITKGWLALINGIFKKYDEEATLENVLAELKEYRGLLIERQRLRLVSLSAQSYDGISSGPTNVNHEEDKMMKRLSKQEEVEMHINLIKKSIELMAEVDDDSERLAAILDFRYLKGYGVTKTCYKYADKFGLPDFPRQTFNDHLREALLTFSEIYPRELRVEKNPS